MSPNRDDYYRAIMQLYRAYLMKFPQTKFSELLWGRYNVDQVNLMTLSQLADLIHLMRKNLEEKAS